MVHDFADDWQVYDEGAKSYVPYIPEYHTRYGSFSLWVNLETARYYQLLILPSKQTYLFINASLQRQIPAGSWAILNVDSLYRQYRVPKVLLTFYSTENLTPLELKVILGNRRTAAQPPSARIASPLLARPHEVDEDFSNFSILAALILLVGYALLYNVYHKTFVRFFNVRDLLTINSRDPILSVNRSFDLSNLLFVGLLSLVLSYLYMLVTHQNVDLFSTQGLLLQQQTLADWFVNFVGIALGIFILFMGKYFALALLGRLYRFERVVDYHFFKDTQASSLFFSALLFLVMSTATSFQIWGSQLGTFLFFPIVLFFLARLALLYFSLNKLATVKSFYLFSYLCIVELIPIIVGIRFAL